MVRAQIDRAHDHAGGAKAALQAVTLFEGGLHGMHGAVGGGQTFDGGDLSAGSLSGQHVAGLDGTPVHHDGAGAALRGVAAYVGSGEVQAFAQYLHQQGVGRHVHAVGFAIDFQLNLHGGGSPWDG